jgi:hypothetical protein
MIDSGGIEFVLEGVLVGDVIGRLVHNAVGLLVV